MIYDIERPFFIIGCEYVCKSPQCTDAYSEGRKFASTDYSILHSLPTKLKDEFPACLSHDEKDAGCGAHIWNWRGLGVSRPLGNMIRGCLRAGLRKDAILHLLDAIQNGIADDTEDGEGEDESESTEAETVQSVVTPSVPTTDARPMEYTQRDVRLVNPSSKREY